VAADTGVAVEVIGEELTLLCSFKRYRIAVPATATHRERWHQNQNGHDAG
jgi:hypothetical protein